MCTHTHTTYLVAHLCTGIFQLCQNSEMVSAFLQNRLRKMMMIHTTNNGSVNISVWTAVSTSPSWKNCNWSYFSIHSTPVLPQQHVKYPSHFAKNAGGRLQLNITYAPYVCGFALGDTAHGCMVYTENTPRRQQFHVAPSQCCKYTYK